MRSDTAASPLREADAPQPAGAVAKEATAVAAAAQLVLGCAYFALTFVGLHYGVVWGTALGAANGVAIAVLLLEPRGRRRVTVAIALVAGVAACAASGSSAAEALGLGAAQAIPVLAFALALMPAAPGQTRVRRSHEMWIFLAAVMAASSLAGLAVAAVRDAHGALAFGQAALRATLAEIAGILLAAPLMLAMADPDEDVTSSRRIAEAAALTLAVALVSAVLLLTPSPSTVPLFRLPYVVLPLLIWASVRFGNLVPRLEILVFAVLAVAATSTGHGPFIRGDEPGWAKALEVQGFLSVTAGLMLILSTALGEQRKLTVAIRRKQRFEAAMLEHAGDGVIACDQAGRLTVLNAAAQRMLGVPASLALGADVGSLQHAIGANTTPPWPSPLAKALRGESLDDLEVLVKLPGEPERLLLASARPILADDARIGAVALIRDVTERRGAERGLAHLAAIVSSSTDAIVAKTLGGVITSWNPAAERMYGYSAAEAIGQSILLVVPEHAMDLHSEHLNRIWSGEGVAQLESARVTKDGRLIDVSLTLSPLMDADGAVTGVVEIAHDITERLSDQRRSREIERRFRRAFEDSPWGMTIVGVTSADAGLVLDANEAFCRLVGRPRGELLGVQLSAELIHPDDVETLERRLEPLLAGERDIVQGRTRLRSSSGGEILTNVTTSLVRDDDGRPLYRISEVQDIRERVAAERKLKAAARHFEVSHDMLCTASMTDGCFVELNGAWTETLGWTIDELRSRPFLDFVHPEDRAATEAEAAGLTHGTRSMRFRNRYRTADGAWVWLEWSSRGVPEEGLIYAAARDVTEQERGIRALAEAEQRFRGAFENAGSGMALVTLGVHPPGRFLAVNDALCELTGRRREELLSLTVTDLTHPEDLASATLERLLDDEGGTTQGELRILGPAGRTLWISATTSPVHDDEGRPEYRVLHVNDITERKEYEKELRHLADNDPLTGLFNRRRFDEEATRELGLSLRHGTGGALMVMDLDNFKTVNDTLGHAAGDILLVRVAGMLSERLRHTDIEARFGGDEFAILLPHTHAEQAARVADDLLRAIRDGASVQTARGRCRITATIGVALFGPEGPDRSVDDLLAEADLALYDAKEAGRDRVILYADRVTRERGRRGLNRVDELRAALQEDRLVLHAQPIVPLAGPARRHYELLVRMIGRGGELILPGTFLAAAERFGVIRELDHWVVGEAIRLLAREQRAGHDARFHVNLSAKSIVDSSFPAFIAAQLAEAGPDPHGLVFEITETGAIVNLEQARTLARSLHGLGCELALDDFGAGFASFYNVKHLDFDYLKIDGEFGRYLPTNRTDQLVVQSTVDIARGLGKRTIAEYVSDAETVELLRNYGVDYVQGYFLGEPRPLDELDLDTLQQIAI